MFEFRFNGKQLWYVQTLFRTHSMLLIVVVLVVVVSYMEIDK